jgi:hypothetical protein
MDKNTPKLSLHSISSLFSDSWKLYKERCSVLLEIVLLPALIYLLGYILVSLNLGPVMSALGGLVLFIGFIIFSFSILPVISSIHNATGVDASYRAAIGWFWSCVWVCILELLAVIGSFFMLIIPGIWLGLALSFVVYVFVIEQRRGIDALRQSKDYVKGYWWAVAGRVLLLGLLFLVAIIIIEIPVTLMLGKTAGSITSMVMDLFFIPFSAIYNYNIFNNLRELKPELADAQKKEGTGFIKASAVVGIVVPVIIMIAVIALVGAGIFSMIRDGGRYTSPPGYNDYNAQVPSQQ